MTSELSLEGRASEIDVWEEHDGLGLEREY